MPWVWEDDWGKWRLKWGGGKASIWLVKESYLVWVIGEGLTKKAASKWPRGSDTLGLFKEQERRPMWLESSEGGREWKEMVLERLTKAEFENCSNARIQYLGSIILVLEI